MYVLLQTESCLTDFDLSDVCCAHVSFISCLIPHIVSACKNFIFVPNKQLCDLRRHSLLSPCLQHIHTLSGPRSAAVLPDNNGFIVDFEYFRDTLYATGLFTKICGETVGHAAKWDGSNWYSVDIPHDGHAMEEIDGVLHLLPISLRTTAILYGVTMEILYQPLVRAYSMKVEERLIHLTCMMLLNTTDRL